MRYAEALSYAFRMVVTEGTGLHNMTLAGNRDSVTGLPNEAAFIAQSRAILADKGGVGRAALQVIKVQNLTDIIMADGLRAGEDVLKIVSGRLYGLLQNDKLFGRLGSDCLGLLQKDIAHEGHISYLARRVLESLERPVIARAQPRHIRAHIGIALYPEHGKSWDELYAHALLAVEKGAQQFDSGYRLYGA